MSEQLPYKPDPVMQKRFNTLMAVLLAIGAGAFFWGEPLLFEAQIGPLLGDAYGVRALPTEVYALGANVAERVAYKSDFYLVLFLGAAVGALFLPMGASRSFVVKRFLLDYSVKCPAEFYLPYALVLFFLCAGAWAAGGAFLSYELNAGTRISDAVLVNIAPFLAVMCAAMTASILKALVVFRIVLRELGAPAPDIENVPDRFIQPWGLRRALFKPLIARTMARYPDLGFTLKGPGAFSWVAGLALPALAVYNLSATQEGAAPLHTALTWIVMGLFMLPPARRVFFQATGQSLSPGTRVVLLIGLLLISGTFAEG